MGHKKEQNPKLWKNTQEMNQSPLPMLIKRTLACHEENDTSRNRHEKNK